MLETNSPLLDGFIRILLSVITVPLLLGGLVAAGESGDGRVLLYGILSLITLGTVSRSKVSTEPGKQA